MKNYTGEQLVLITTGSGGRVHGSTVPYGGTSAQKDLDPAGRHRDLQFPPNPGK